MQKKRLIGLLLALMMIGVLISTAYASETENLLVNGSFEEIDTEGLPVGWYTEAYIKQEGYTTYSVNGDAHEGSRGAVINNIGLNDARFAQTVRVEPESLYCLSGWVKVEDMTDSGRGANLSIEDLYVFSNSVYESDGEWHYLELYGETGEDQQEVTVFVRVGGYSGESQGKAVFDSISLRKVDALPDDLVATLWFKTDVPVIEDEPVEDSGEAEGAAPFWPWLIAIALCYAALAAWMVSALTLDKHELQEKSKTPTFLVTGLCLAALARIVVALLVEGYQVDVNCFRAWGATMAEYGPTRFYESTSFCDYTPAYLYVMGLNRLIYQGLSSLFGHNSFLSILASEAFAHKLVPMLCDMLAACFLYRFATEEKLTRRQAGLMSLLIAFNPAMFINSAAWCQMDSVLCLGLMLVAWLSVRRKWQAVLPVYVLCALIKPQALMLGPLGLAVLIVEWMRHKEDRRAMLIGLGLSAVVAAVIIIPFGIHQQPGWLIALYGRTLSSYPYATINTANLYYLLGANWTPIDSQAGWLPPLCLTLGCAAWGLVLFFRQKGKKYGLLEPVLMGCFALAFLVMACVNATWTVVGATAMALSFAIVLPMYIRGGKLRNLPLAGAILFILLYVIGLKMHERYLFPALILLAMAFLLHRDRRILLLLAAMSCTVAINEGIVLDNSLRLGPTMGHLNNDTKWLNMLLAAVNVLCVPLAVWVGHRVCAEEASQRLDTSLRPVIPMRRYLAKPCHALNYSTDPRLHWKRIDWVLMLSVTVIYAVVALWNLGSTKAPQNPWKSTANNESVILDLGDHYDDFSMLYYCQVSYNDFSVATSEDRSAWSEEYWAEMAQGQCFRWKYLSPYWTNESGKRTYTSATSLDGVQKLSGRYVRVTAQQIGLILNEVIFRDSSGTLISATVVDHLNANEDSPLLTDPQALLDEQDTLEGEPSWYNSTYFDEIYHARTAYEHLHGTAPYETSHPPLGKVIMSWFIGLFGMTPFGWRFAGAFAGILMLPVMYLMGKQLTKRTDMAFAAMTMMALDCMHLTQTRIATIDSFPVLFILLSYFFMARFMQRDIVLEPLKKILPDLALSGFFMGCGIASKWIGVYAGAGLAVLYFWTCARHLRLSCDAARLLRASPLSWVQGETLRLRDQISLRRILLLCLWCVLFFIVVPCVIYLLSYVPYFAYAHKENFLDYLDMVLRTQQGMFDYHSTPGLGMDHPFYSPWYEWPLIKRPMYYAMAQFMPEGYSCAIFCFGNPAVWLTGLAGMAVTLGVWFKRHCYVLEGSDSTVHLFSDCWYMVPAFILVGLLAQFLPWVLVPRGTYIYHYFASVPFLILGTMMMLYWISKRLPRVGRAVLIAYLVVCLIMFIGYYPYASGMTTPTWWLDFMKQFLRIYYG